jgi:uncharacterized short protein YbdD (DUF466 family)
MKEHVNEKSKDGLTQKKKYHKTMRNTTPTNPNKTKEKYKQKRTKPTKLKTRCGK